MLPLPKPETRDRGKRRKAHIPPTQNTCIPPTPPPPRVHKLMTDAQSLRVQFTGVTVPNPGVEKSDPRVETAQPHQADITEPIYRCTHLHQLSPILMPTDPVAQHTRSHTANLVSPSQASGRQ